MNDEYDICVVMRLDVLDVHFTISWCYYSIMTDYLGTSVGAYDEAIRNLQSDTKSSLKGGEIKCH